MKKGQIVAYIEQLGTFVPVEVSCTVCEKLQQLHIELASLCQWARSNFGNNVGCCTVPACDLRLVYCMSCARAQQRHALRCSTDGPSVSMLVLYFAIAHCLHKVLIHAGTPGR